MVIYSYRVRVTIFNRSLYYMEMMIQSVLELNPIDSIEEGKKELKFEREGFILSL